MRGGLVEKRKYQVSAEKVGRIVLDSASENFRKHKAHDKQHKKRREHTPAHSENGALVFFLEIALYELFKKKLVFFKFLKHKTSKNLIMKTSCQTVRAPRRCISRNQRS